MPVSSFLPNSLRGTYMTHAGFLDVCSCFTMNFLRKRNLFKSYMNLKALAKNQQLIWSKELSRFCACAIRCIHHAVQMYTSR